MTSPKTEKSNWPPSSKPDGLELSYEWNGLSKGDPIRIAGDRTGVYKFMHHTRYPNGSEGVTVFGGVGQHRMHREVGVDAIEREGEEATSSGNGIAERRKALGMSRKEVAQKAGVSESAVYTLEKGGTPRDADAVRAAVDSVLGAYPGHGIVAPDVKDTGAIPIPPEWNEEQDEDDD